MHHHDRRLSRGCRLARRLSCGAQVRLLGSHSASGFELESDPDRIGDNRLDLLIAPRFVQEAVHLAVVHGIDDGGEIGKAGQQNADAIRRNLFRLPQEVNAGHLRHPLVADDDVNAMLLQDRERSTAGSRREDLILVAKERSERVEDSLLVVDEKDLRAFHPGFAWTGRGSRRHWARRSHRFQDRLALSRLQRTDHPTFR